MTHPRAMRSSNTLLYVLLRVVSRTEKTHVDVTVWTAPEGDEGVCTRGQEGECVTERVCVWVVQVARTN